MGALFGPMAKAQEAQTTRPGITILAATEQDTTDKNNTEVTLKPDMTCRCGEYALGYYGSFYRAKSTPGEVIGWLTLASNIRAENDDWALTIGRTATRTCAGYLYAPTTSGFDNRAMTRGTSRTFTGAILTHKGSGLTLGQVASDTRMTPTHWDSTLLGWAKDLDREWSIHLQATTGRRPLSTLGATLKWQPSPTTTLVAEGFFWNRETTAILTGNHKLTEDLILFAGAQMTHPNRGKPDGLATAGACYNLGGGIQLVLAAGQGLGRDKRTSFLFGLKYAGNFR